MKKNKIILLLIPIMFLCMTSVFATSQQISLEGDTSIKPGETKLATINIKSESVEIGVISGKIEKNSNITNMKVRGKNNWNLTYNQETGVFNVYKAEGTKNDEIIDIEYTVTNEEGIGKITISDIKITTIDYETKEVENISKEIMIENEKQDNVPEAVTLTGIKITKSPLKTEYKEGEKFDKTGMIVIAEYSNGTSKEITNYTYMPMGNLAVSDTKILITYKEDNVTKTTQQGITVEKVTEINPGEDTNDEDTISDKNTVIDNNIISNENTVINNDTTSNKELPKAGNTSYILILIVIIGIIIPIKYIRYKKYKNI